MDAPKAEAVPIGYTPGEHSLPTSEPVGPVFIISGRGFIFDAKVARRLRDEHHIVGAAVGALSGYKQQDTVHGLPVELLPEELTFALHRGWLFYGGAFPPDPPPKAAGAAGGSGAAANKQQNRHQKAPVRWTGGPKSSSKPQPSAKAAAVEVQPCMAVVKAPGRILIPLTNPWRAGAPPSGAELAGRVSEAACSSGGEAAAAAGPQATGAAAAAGAEDSAAAPDSKRRKLEAAGASSAGAGSHADASGGAAPRGGETGAGDAAAGPSSEADAAAALFARVPGLSFPATRLERIRMSVFADLSKRGYYLSTGAKFGSDFLAYPGDPAMYHAQFTVRCLDSTEPIHPLSLGAVSRMAHTARKSVLLASAVPLGARGGGGEGPWAEAEFLPGEGVGYVTVRPDISQSSQRTNR